ncbi:MAG: PH domain-containing protein [Corynebacterium sp.]|uniref:PH domain-containing protein n=1 Tax=uncultured Corynebacterium sp. TaxID=159447 RepID=UPI0017D3B886|nr:PH domain-containing protein [uncultured Corynebacterium sp.]NLZ58037.1 PH domain-containing protein [Corynebacterium sp.]
MTTNAPDGATDDLNNPDNQNPGNVEQADREHKIRLSDEELQIYTAAFAGTTTDKPWKLVVTSKTMKQIAWFIVVVVMAVHIFMGAVVDVDFTGAAVSFIDTLAFPGIGVLLSILAYIAFTRARVRANEDGVEVRNFIGTRFYPWAVIYGMSFPKGARVARLELPDFEYVPMWAFQARDGESVVSAVAQFRELENKHMPED